MKESVVECLRSEGLCVNEDWLTQELQSKDTSRRHYSSDAIAQEVFRKAIFSDFNQIASGCLPPNIDHLHDVYLKGPYILQIDEMINIANTIDKRHTDGPGRMLKIFATDGEQNVICLEQQHLPDLKLSSHNAGVKVCLFNVYVRRGMLLLSNRNTKVLGGHVDFLKETKLASVTATPNSITSSGNPAPPSANNADTRRSPHIETARVDNATAILRQQQPEQRNGRNTRQPPTKELAKSWAAPIPQGKVNRFNNDDKNVGDNEQRNGCISGDNYAPLQQKTQAVKRKFVSHNFKDKSKGNVIDMTDDEDVSIPSMRSSIKPNGMPLDQNISIRNFMEPINPDTRTANSDIVNKAHATNKFEKSTLSSEYHPVVASKKPKSSDTVAAIDLCSPSVDKSDKLGQRSSPVLRGLSAGYEGIGGRKVSVSGVQQYPPSKIVPAGTSDARVVHLPHYNISSTLQPSTDNTAIDVMASLRPELDVIQTNRNIKLTESDKASDRQCESLNGSIVEGSATGIKKFSVVEKKVKVPYYLVHLLFNDGNTIKEFNISSQLCEEFLDMSALQYIEKRNNFIKLNNLDKKKGSDDYKRHIAPRFEHFVGKFSVVNVNGEATLNKKL